MSIGSETAEQMTREAIQISEGAAELAALGAKNLAALCLALANENQKLRGKTHMNALLRSGKELRVFDLKEQDLAAFRREAKSTVFCSALSRTPPVTAVMWIFWRKPRMFPS